MTKIALVDDDASIRKAIGRLLRTHGYDCVAYESAETALSDPDLPRMDCLLIDVQLGSIDGFKLRDWLQSSGSSLPHIFITAHSEQDWPDWRTRMGDSTWLAKPVDEQLLISEIERLIHHNPEPLP
jgi:FixJ family two-component response regulator